MSASDILVLYYTQGGSIRRMAELIADGIERVPGATARLRTVPKVAATTTIAEPLIPAKSPAYESQSGRNQSFDGPPGKATCRHRSLPLGLVTFQEWRKN